MYFAYASNLSYGESVWMCRPISVLASQHFDGNQILMFGPFALIMISFEIPDSNICK